MFILNKIVNIYDRCLFDFNLNQLESHKSKTCLDILTLNQHELNVTQHLNNKTITCNNLNKSIRNKAESELSHNSIGKEKARSLECDQCQMKFKYSSNLKDHKRIHSGLKPFKCDQCEKKFTQSQHLKTHKRIHTKEKPYECDKCVCST